MPAYIRQALADHGLTKAYDDRPPYQQNDYIGWITRAKREETRRKRLVQMLDELQDSDRYMESTPEPIDIKGEPISATVLRERR